MKRIDKENRVLYLYEKDLNKGKRYDLMRGVIGVMDLCIWDVHGNVRNGVVRSFVGRGYRVVFRDCGKECLIIYNK